MMARRARNSESMSEKTSSQPRVLFSTLIAGGGLAFFIGSSISNASNFVFHVLMSRLLGPVTYGALGSLLGLITVVSFAVGALQAAVTQAVAERTTEAGESRSSLALRRHFVHAGVAALATLGVIVALSPAIDGYLHLASPIPVVLLSVFVAVSIITLLPQGVLLGKRSFRIVAVSLILGAIVRLVSALALTALGFGLDGALGASVLASFVTLGILLWPLRFELSSAGGIEMSVRFSSAFLAVAALGGFSVFVGIDSFLARHYLSGSAAGHYVAAATAARIALFLPGAVALIAFPKLASVGGSGQEARRVLASSVAAVAVLGTLAAVVMIAVPHLVISLLFGAKYQSAAASLEILALPAAGLGLVSLLVYFQLARRSRQALLGWAGVFIGALLITLWHARTTEIAWDMFGATAVTVAALAIAAFIRASEHRHLLVPNEDGTCTSPPELDISIVIPYFNAGERLRKTAEETIAVLDELSVSYELIAVSDGSTDGSEQELSGLAPDHLRCFSLSSNQGKGEALRVGMKMGRGEYLGFIDGDGDLPPLLLREFVHLVRTEQPDIVIGSKRHPDSRVVYPVVRRLYSWIYQQAVRLMFRLTVRDTQTGIKLIKRDVLADVLPRMLEKRFAFDLELLVVARQRGYGHVVELPVEIRARFGSTISIRAVRQTLTDTLAIFYRLRILQSYGPRCHVPVTQPLSMPLVSRNNALDQPTRLASSESIERVGRPAGVRILIFNWRDIKHSAAGGAEVYAHEVCREWVKLGHDVTFFTSRHDRSASAEVVDGIKIIRRGGRLTVYWRARLFYRSEGRGRFDLVVDAVNTRPFLCPRFVKDAPVLAIFHQVAMDVWNHELPLPIAVIGRRLLEPFWLRRYREVPVVAVSDSTRQSLESFGIYGVSVVPEGIRAADVEQREAQQAPPREERPTVLFVGRLTSNKRPDHAITAFKRAQRSIPDLQMWVIGTGPLERQLRAKQLSSLRFLGRVSEQVKQERLGRAHAVLATSVREGWGLIVTEAAACGTPTIAYDVPGLRDSVLASGGILVEPDPSALSTAIVENLPRWADGDMPHVEPSGVILWSEVACELLKRIDLAGMSQSVPDYRDDRACESVATESLEH